MAGGSPLPPKRDVALALLQESNSMYVHLDPRRKGVVVPKNFTRQHQLVLQVGMNMPLPIPDLDVNEEGIGCTLSFSRRPFWCFMPWHAVYALVSEDSRGMVWPDDVPPEVAGQRQKPRLSVVGGKGSKKDKAEAPKERDDEEPKEPAARPRLAVATAAAMKLPPDEPEEVEPPKRAHLSVVPPADDAEAEAGEAEAGEGDSSAAAAEPAEPNARPVLKSVPTPVPDPPEDDPDDPGPDDGGLPPYLRVVK